jgi:signal transduction histidine kinase
MLFLLVSVVLIIAILIDTFVLKLSVLRFCTSVIIGIGYLIMLFTFFMVRNEETIFITQYNTTKQTVEQARKEQKTPYELAAIQSKIIEVNEEIVNKQYYANSIWVSVFYPKEIRKLELLK